MRKITPVNYALIALAVTALLVTAFLIGQHESPFEDNKNLITTSGEWPTNPNKSDIEDPAFEPVCPGAIGCNCLQSSDCTNGNCVQWPKADYCTALAGSRLPNFKALDQYGNEVELYDFANHGKRIVIELATAWCPGCNDLASWFATGDLSVTTRNWWKPEFNAVKEIVDNEEVFYITILYSNAAKGDATPADVANWHTNYPHDKIVVLADSEKLMHTWVKPSGIPTAFLVDENMDIIQFSSRGLTEAFTILGTEAAQ